MFHYSRESCRNLQSGESQLKENEEALLDSICKAYYLPKWCSINDYEKLFQENGLQGIKTADWSEEVAPFWGAVIKSALSTQGVLGLFKAGLTTIKVCLVAGWRQLNIQVSDTKLKACCIKWLRHLTCVTETQSK